MAGDEDTKRAMMKSFQESGGTQLSTNWKEVGKQKMEVKPPEGQEWRDWKQEALGKKSE
jgi:suppressor of G2 allele of SKP1